MKVQDLTDAVANGQTGVSHSKEIISPLKQILIQRNDCEMATLVDNLKNIDKAIRMIKELDDEATQEDWCSTELSKNEQSRTTLADDASNLKNLENPMIHFAVNEQSERFAPHGSIKAVLQTIDKMLVALVEEEKSDIIERDASQTMGKSITDKNEDESLKGVEGDSIHDFATLPSGRTVTVKPEGYAAPCGHERVSADSTCLV